MYANFWIAGTLFIVGGMFRLIWTLNLNSVTWCNGVILFTVLCVTILFTHLCCRFIYAIWSMQGQATYLPLTGLAKSDEQKKRFWLPIAGCCLTINKYFYFLFLLYLLPWVGWGGQFISTIQTIDYGFSVLLYVPVELARPIHLTCSGCFWLVRNRILKNSRASEPIWYILEMKFDFKVFLSWHLEQDTILEVNLYESLHLSYFGTL